MDWKYSTSGNYLLLILCMILWGITWPLTDYLVTIAPPLTIGFFRFFFASLLFIPLLLSKYRDKIRSYTFTDFLWFIMLGLTGIFGYGIFFLFGLTYTTAAQGAIIAGANPAFISLFAHFIHQERLPRKWMYAGFVFSFLGVIFVIGIQSLINFQLNHLFGNILIFFAMICWSTYSNIGKQVMKKHSPVETTGMAVIFGMFFFFVAALSEKFWILKSAYNNSFFWLSVIFLGSVITFFTFLIFFYSVNRIGATTSSIFINLVPIFGTWFSYIFLKEEIYWTFLIGLLLIIIGIILINFPVKQTKLNERSSE